MTDEKLEQPRNITLWPDRMQSGAIVKQEIKSDIEVYKEILVEKLALAKTSEECEKVIKMRQTVHELDREERQLNYTQQSAETKLQEDKQEAVFQRSQKVVASVISIGIGIYFIQAFPLAGLLFLILGLAKPLGYSLLEIGYLLDGLKGFFKDSNELLSNGNEKKSQSEGAKHGRS